MMMKPFLFMVVLGSFFVHGTTTSNNNDSSSGVVNNTDTIHWRPDYKLRADDFRGKPRATSKFAAESNIDILFTSRFFTDVSGITSISFNVDCIFNKKKSWIVNKNGQDIDYVLLHEQGHFDIAELYRRILVERLKQIVNRDHIQSKDNVTKRTDLIISQTLKERDALEQQYDVETSHNRDSLRQSQWIGKIDSMLNTYK